MKSSNKIFLLVVLLFGAAFSCTPPQELADAYGNFEATEILVSAEGTGKLLQLEIEEGQKIASGQLVGLIDTLPLHLKRQQVKATIRAIQLKTQDAQPQIAILQEQKENPPNM